MSQNLPQSIDLRYTLADAVQVNHGTHSPIHIICPEISGLIIEIKVGKSIK